MTVRTTNNHIMEERKYGDNFQEWYQYKQVNKKLGAAQT